MLDLLNHENRNDLVASMMNQTTYPGWGFLLNERKVTTWPETWSGWGSQIIQVVGSPGAWFYEGLAGIRPDPVRARASKRSFIKPAIVGDLTWVKGALRLAPRPHRQQLEARRHTAEHGHHYTGQHHRHRVCAGEGCRRSDRIRPACRPAEGVKFLRLARPRRCLCRRRRNLPVPIHAP